MVMSVEYTVPVAILWVSTDFFEALDNLKDCLYVRQSEWVKAIVSNATGQLLCGGVCETRW
jgi:hypothetical protein